MKQSANEQVQSFLDNLLVIDPASGEMVVAARDIIFQCYDGLEEKIMYGGIVFFYNKEMFAGLFAYKNHVSLELSNGHLMDDPLGILEGKGKYRRHIKMRSKTDTAEKDIRFYVQQAVR